MIRKAVVYWQGKRGREMKGFTVSQAAEACGGRLSCEMSEDRELNRVVIDSRKVEPGDLFVAYRGEKTDGHAYRDGV